MKILDRYISKKLIPIFLILSISTIILICILDYVPKYYIFRNLKFKQIIYFYCLHSIPLLKFILPITAFIAVSLTVKYLSDSNELMAFFSVGNSFNRFLQPFLFYSIFGIKFIFIIECFLTPMANKLKEDFKKNNNIDRKFNNEKQGDIYIKISKTKLLFIKDYDIYNDIGEDVIIDEIVDSKIVSRICAQKIKWDDDEQKWLLLNWTKRVFKDEIDTVTQGHKAFLNGISLQPDTLWVDLKLAKKLTMPTLIKYIRKLAEQGSSFTKYFKIEQTERLKSPFLFFIFIFTAIFIFFKTNNRNNKKKKIIDLLIFLILSLLSFIPTNLMFTVNINVFILTFSPILFGLLYITYMYKKILL